jgi:phosphatidylglycerophosphatase A
VNYFERLLSLLLPKIVWIYILAFLTFRFFDILKLFPINRVEKIKAGWGIMLDDIVAGFLSFLLVNLFRFLGGKFGWFFL